MAALHAANLPAWRTDRFARDAFDAVELDHLTAHLRRVANGSLTTPPVRATLGVLVAGRA